MMIFDGLMAAIICTISGVGFIVCAGIYGMQMFGAIIDCFRRFTWAFFRQALGCFLMFLVCCAVSAVIWLNFSAIWRYCK
jgi:hypothetical protein